MVDFSLEDRKLLSAHVSNMDKNIYLIKNLPPEVVAVLFAYVSRSPATFRENLLKLIKEKDIDLETLVTQVADHNQAKEKARKFHEKWVVGYGHSSVAEHAVASIALEDVSILASKTIEDNRLASFTEKSTRYQIFDHNRYYKPQLSPELEKLFEETCNYLFDLYSENINKAIEFMKKKYPRGDQPERVYEAITKARACDIMRYILPIGTLTNIGMTGNSRVYEHAIRKLISHPLQEMRNIGIGMKTEIQKLIPTLVRHADHNSYIHDTKKDFHTFTPTVLDKEVTHEKPVSIVGYDQDAENRLVAGMLYKYTEQPYSQIMQKVKSMTNQEKDEIFEKFLKSMSKFDWPLRELEHVNYTFDILIDYGAFRDIQRHRICTQTNQLATVTHGYDIPEEIKEMGLGEKFSEAMERARETFLTIQKSFPYEAQYVIPLAYRRRTLFTWNLRELHHFIKLRTSRQGHTSYRIVARACYDELAKLHPLIAKYIRVQDIDGPAR
jgi:thymidylate synthase ThyX